MNTLLNLLHTPVAERFGWVLIHFLWEGTAIALVAAAALSFIPRAFSNVRYLIVSAAFFITALAPAGTWVALGRGEVISHGAMVQGDDSKLQVAATFSATKGARPEAVAGPIAATVSEPLRVSSLRRWLTTNLGRCLPGAVGFWFCGVVVLTGRLAFGLRGVRRIRRSGFAVSNREWEVKLRELAGRMLVKTPMRLLQSSLIEVPTLIGWLRPVILLPTSVFTGLEPRQLEAILAHELAHIRRCDYAVNVIQTIIETALFYHPAIWWMSRAMREERENCCDDIALRVIEDRAVYAGALMALEQARGMGPNLALAATGGKLLARVRRLSGAERRRVSFVPAFAAIVLLGGLAIPFATQFAKAQDAGTGKTTAVPIASGSNAKGRGANPSPGTYILTVPAVFEPTDGSGTQDSADVEMRATGKPIIGAGPGSVLDIPWGASPADVTAAMGKRHGFQFSGESNSSDRFSGAYVLNYNGGNFAGIPLGVLSFHFTDGKLSLVRVFFESSIPDKYGQDASTSIGTQLQKALAKKYGAPTKSQRAVNSRTITWNFAEGADATNSKEIEYYNEWSRHSMRLTYTNLDIIAAEKAESAVPKVSASDL